RFGQLCPQMLAEVLFVVPRLVAQRTLWAIDQFKPLFDECPALQGGQQAWILLQCRQVRDNPTGVSLRQLRETLGGFGQAGQIAESRLLVEVRPDRRTR